MLPAQHNPEHDQGGSDGVSGTQGTTHGEGCPYIGFKAKDPNMLDPVVLWDACMAWCIGKQLDASPGDLVYHVCGSFHCQHRLGICEMLEHYQPGCKALVVSVYPDDNFRSFDADEYKGKGDFVVLTDAKVRQGAGEAAQPAE